MFNLTLQKSKRVSISLPRTRRRQKRQVQSRTESLTQAVAPTSTLHHLETKFSKSHKKLRSLSFSFFCPSVSHPLRPRDCDENKDSEKKWRAETLHSGDDWCYSRKWASAFRKKSSAFSQLRLRQEKRGHNASAIKRLRSRLWRQVENVCV